MWAWWTWMSGVAWLLYDLWYWDNLICLDSTESELTQKLQKKGIKVIIWVNKYLPDIKDNVIYSEACVNSTEVLHAKSYQRNAKQQKFIWNYFTFLWELSKYFTTIWITWTNGKSTTTSLAIHTARKHLPNFWLGILWALVPDLDNNNYYLNQNHKKDIKNIFDQILNGKWLDYSLIKKYYFILEACEYKRHFLKLDVDRWIITNIELDHTDYYKDLTDYTSAFEEFSKKVKNKILVLKISKITKTLKHLKPVETIETFSFTHLFWEHNKQNWSLVFELIKQLNPKINEEELIKTIQEFKGLRRRLELFNQTKKWTLIFSDYGHMASSINFCYQALRSKYPNHKITAIFQPHQGARIIEGRNDFPKALKNYDEIVIFDIYAARENISELMKKAKIDWINTIEELWQIFAKKCWWIYTKNLDKITEIIESKKDQEIIVIFTAWDLDFKIRNFLSQK